VVKFHSFSTAPYAINCLGGTTEVALKFDMTNTIGKVCKITAKSLNNSAADGVSTQMDKLNELLATSIYDSKVNSGPQDTSMSSVLSKLDSNGHSIAVGTMVLPKVNGADSKLSNGKRLFNYSTRFTLECGAPSAANANTPVTSGPTYSVKLTDLVSTCTTQN
jgi:hypothetical protein